MSRHVTRVGGRRSRGAAAAIPALNKLTLALMLFAQMPAFADSLTGATVSGTVLFSGRVQSLTADESDASRPIDDPAARPLEFAFVYLEVIDAPVPELPSTPAHVYMDQRGIRFVPLVLSATAGQTVIFGNADSTDHNIRGISENAKNEFNIVTRPEHTYEKSFEPQPLIAPLRLACDFHPNMEAWIYIVDGPWHQVTGPDGAFSMGPVPAGKYRLHVRDPAYRMAASVELEVADGERVAAKVTFGVPHKFYRAEPPVLIEHPAATDPPEPDGSI